MKIIKPDISYGSVPDKRSGQSSRIASPPAVLTVLVRSIYSPAERSFIHLTSRTITSRTKVDDDDDDPRTTGEPSDPTRQSIVFLSFATTRYWILGISGGPASPFEPF